MRSQQVGVGRQDLLEQLARPTLARDDVHHDGGPAEPVADVAEDFGKRGERHREDDDVGSRHLVERGGPDAVARLLDLCPVGVMDEDLAVSRERRGQEPTEMAVADDAERLEAHVQSSVSKATAGAATGFRRALELRTGSSTLSAGAVVSWCVSCSPRRACGPSRARSSGSWWNAAASWTASLPSSS